MTQTPLIAAADCADSLLTTKRTRIVLFVLILFTLLAQLTLFFVVRYKHPHLLEAPATPGEKNSADLLQYFIGMLDFAGMILPAMLTVTLFVTLQVQLVGRLLGTAKMTTALLWSVLLFLLLFPWQAVLNNPAINSDVNATAIGLKIPGVLYTWAEFARGTGNATFVIAADDLKLNILHWARFVGFPVFAVLLLIWIQFKSDGGLKQAMGRDLIVTDPVPVN